MGELVLTPEQDGGASFAGRCVVSANLWVPIEHVRDPDSIIRAGTVLGGSPRMPQLAIELVVRTPTHLVIPRHMDLIAVSRFLRREVLEFPHEVVDFGDRVSPRDDKQTRAWAAFSLASNGVMSVACGGGKTVLGLKKIAQRGFPALVIVNSESLVEQWIDRATTFLTLSKDDIGIVQGDKAQWDRPLVLAMIHTLAARSEAIPEEVRRRFGTIIWDEIQHLSANSFARTADMFYGARFGLSATPTRADKLEGVYFAHVGGVFYCDVSSEINATVYVKKTGTALREGVSLSNYDGTLNISKLYEVLAGSKARNELIVSDAAAAARAGRKVLVLSHSVEHVELLGRLLAESGVDVGVVTGKVKGAKRLDILRTRQVTCATFTLAKEGLDVPSLDTLLLTTPFRDWGAFQQCKGRIERAHPGKKTPRVVLYDDQHIGPSAAMCGILRREMKSRGIAYSVIPT